MLHFVPGEKLKVVPISINISLLWSETWERELMKRTSRHHDC